VWRVERLVERSWFRGRDVSRRGKKLTGAVQNRRGLRVGVEAARDDANGVQNGGVIAVELTRDLRE
jgi:hypothetical protein